MATVTELVDASMAIAERLCRTARWHGDRCRWQGAEGGDLYEGTGGIAWFLADAAVEAGRSDFAQTALGAARNAVDWVGESRRTAAAGLFCGDVGAVWAATHVATLLSSQLLANEAARDAVAIARNLTTGGRAGCDVTGGLAGTILALLLIGDRHAPGATRAAIDAGVQLAERAQVSMAGSGWPPLDAAQPPTVGLGHGASGIVVALTELTRVEDRGQFLQVARAGALFETAWFDRSSCLWREPGSGAPTGTSWCRGAVGIGLARLRVADLIGETRMRAEAGAALALVHSRLAALPVDTAADAGRAGDSSICHGLMGVVDLLVHASTVTAATAHREVARELGIGLTRAAAERGHWKGGTLDMAETPGLMLGVAGIGAALLRIERAELGPIGLPPPIK